MPNRAKHIAFLPVALALLLVCFTSCKGEDINSRVAKLHSEAMVLAEQAVEFQQGNKINAAQIRYREAVGKYHDILSLTPNSYEALLNLGILYNYFGDYAKAEEVLDEAIQIDRANGRAYFYRGFVYLKKGDPREAEIAFKMSIERDETYAPAYFFYGKVEYELGDFYKSKTALERYVELEPSGAYASFAKEYLKRIPEDIAPAADIEILPSPQAVAAEESPASTGPEQPVPPAPQTAEPEPPQEPGTTSPVEDEPSAGPPEEATPQPQPEPAPPPTEPKPLPEPAPAPEEPGPTTYGGWIEAGQWAMAMNNYDDAIGHFRRAYELEPLFTEVNYLLGKAYRATKDLNKAIDHLKIALNQSPDDANSLLEIAYCYEEQGAQSLAIEYFEKSLAIKDRDDIRKHVEELRGG